MGLKTVCFAGIVLVLAVAASATLGFGAITGSPHDFSGRGWGSTEVCIFCHTPHNSSATPLAPLWNHTSTAVAAYTLYGNSSTLNAVPGQPSGASKACLSCHDGTVGLDAYGGRAGTTNISGSALMGTDLSNDHPVSFTYDAALATADGGLVTPASASLVVTGIPLFAQQVQCASCHAVHDNAAGNFLRVANTGSALCLKCHTK